MNTYNVNSLPAELTIGRQTETGVTRVGINCSAWLDLWPELDLYIWVTPPGGGAQYPAHAYLEDEVLVWEVNDGDTAVEGKGTIEVVGIADGLRKLSTITTIQVLRTTTRVSTTTPDPARPWVEQVLEAASAAQDSAYQAAKDAARTEQAVIDNETAAQAAALAEAAKEAALEATAEAANVLASIPGDYKALSDEVKSTINRLTTPFSITGGVVNCHPVGGYPLEVISHIEPVQDGSGWTGAVLNRTGKNLVPLPYENDSKTTRGITFALNDDGTVTVTGTATDNASFHITTTAYYPAGVYRLSGGISNNIRFVANKYRADGGESSGAADTGNGATLTLTERTKLHIYLVIMAGTTVDNVVFAPQIEIGTTATAYEKSEFEEITAQFGQTIYGGTYNWKTGILTITHALDDKQAVTALPVPEKIQLTPQQAIVSAAGVNHIWSDCGETTVNGPTDPKYRDEMQDQRIAALEAAMLNA